VRTVLIVDAANVVGSVPNGWWRDRAGAARRLRDALGGVSHGGIAGVPGSVEVVLVVEGAARAVGSTETVEVIAAQRSGDDTIVELVAQRFPAAGGGAPTRDTAGGAPSAGAGPVGAIVVVTADRGLRERVTALGASVVGPRSLPYG
jgi:hypothetical protein